MKQRTLLTAFVLAVSTVLAVGYIVVLGSVQGSAPEPPPQTSQANPCIITEQGGGDFTSDVDTDTGGDANLDFECEFSGNIETGEGEGSPPPPPPPPP
jgi:hypothetical protein